ncbi:MAG: Gldg family protein [Pirellulaceae bacterium]
MVRLHVISAIFGRNIGQYFSGVLGYLFIIVFVTLCALATFSQQFFANNVASLDQLTLWLPTLLLFLAPAITMSVWAEERKQGTDSLLFTLPASDVEIMLGKYLAVSAVYTIALVFSTTQLIALKNLGNPDWGVIVATYAGYWLLGLSLLAMGMFASSLTDSTTVAFVVGAVLCSVPVLIGFYFRGNLWLEPLGAQWHLRDFGLGLVTVSGIAYFVSIIVLFLYLNLVVISKRHWKSTNKWSMWLQYSTRFVSLVVAVISINFVVNAFSSSSFTRIDLTEEQAFSLAPMTLETLQKAKDSERQVTIQAFVSKDIPRNYVEAKHRFTGLLRQLDYFGGANVDVRISELDTESTATEEAETLGIQPQSDRTEIGGKTVEQAVYLGAHISSSIDDATISTLDNESAIEYELTRAIANTTERDWQIKVGVLVSEPHFEGLEIEGRTVPWRFESTLASLKQAYDVVVIEPFDLSMYASSEEPTLPSQSEDAESKPSESPKVVPPKLTPPDVLLVAAPSSLDAMTADSLVRYMNDGNPTILLFDPVNFLWPYQSPDRLGLLTSPRIPEINPQSPNAPLLSASPLPKADEGRATRILECLGMEWDNGRTVWSTNNPHRDFVGKWPDHLGDSWPEFYGPFECAFQFATDSNLNREDEITKHLNEILLFYPGSFSPTKDIKDQQLSFTPLISSGTQSGVIEWENLTETPTAILRSMDPNTGRIITSEEPDINRVTGNPLVRLRISPKTAMDANDYVIAARIQGTGKRKLEVVCVADLDFLSDIYNAQDEALNHRLDNHRFLQNAIETLAGKSGFVALRSRNASPRTLTAFEKRIAVFQAERAKEEKVIEEEIAAELKVAQNKLNATIDSINADESASFFEKIQMSSQSQLDASSQFERVNKKLNEQLKRKKSVLKKRENEQIASLESRIRSLAVLLAPLPAILLGTFVLLRRKFFEDSQVNLKRRVNAG